MKTPQFTRPPGFSTHSNLSAADIWIFRSRRSLRVSWRFLRKWPVFPSLVLGALLISALFANWIAPHDPYAANLRARLDPPAWDSEGSFTNLLGVDHLGRDVFSRVIHGASVSLVITVVVISVSGVIGTILGMIAGYYGGLTDEFILRLVEMTISIPLLLIAMIATMAFGSSLQLLITVLALFSWPGFTRQVRAEVLRLRNMEYVQMSKVCGASTSRIFARHLLPNIVNTVIVLATLLVGSLILTESILSFLGAGVPPPRPAWGSMVSEGRDFLSNAWWIATFPGLAIVITVLGFNFLGDWLRDFFDPRLRQIR
ncbi:MAG: ABC transporter permease [Dehalococcoidia bacterium]